VKPEFNDPTTYYKHLSLFWVDLLHLMSGKPASLMSVGPMRNFATNVKKINTELIESNEDLTEFNKNLLNYYKQLADTWNIAQKKVNTKTSKLPKDSEQFETYKRIWIDMFENDFTSLFDSKDFGENYGKLVSSELELTKHWNNMLDTLLQSANLPTRKEIDEVYLQLNSLRKKISKLELELKNQRKKGSSIGK